MATFKIGPIHLTMRAWEEFLTLQEKELGQETVSKWLRPLKVIRFDACNLYLEAQDSFKALWFEEHIRHKVETTLFNNNNKKIKVHTSIVSQEGEKKPLNHQKKGSKNTLTSPIFTLHFDEVDPEAGFDSFIISQNNLLAHKLLTEACCQEQKNSSLSFNPIFLFGRSGSGKTHLMMAAANSFKKQGFKVIYVRADTFTEHVVNAIRTGEMQTFRKVYRNADVLLIDDIEIFSRKSATQEELFHTFNTLHLEGKQIILSATCPPQELKFIEPRLVSRFEWGIVIPMPVLAKEKLHTVLVQKAEKMNYPLDEKVVDFLLETFDSSTKTLIRALEALALRTHLNQGVGTPAALPLKLKTVQNYLSDLIQEEKKSVLTPGKIIRSVAQYYGIQMDDILSKSQARECVLPRQIAMHLCRQELNLPYMKIGDLFSRDHSTVMASVKQIQKGLETKNHEIAGSLKGILKTLQT
ncbi:MAG: chromosomal replication initiator protein DnaA [Chlamydiales bacterium]